MKPTVISAELAESLRGDIMKTETEAEQLFFVTTRIETEQIDTNGNTVIGVGTGFIVSYKWDGKKGYFLITNKHIFEKAQKARFFFIKSDGGKPILGETQHIEVDNLQNIWFGHPNSKIDVALMPLSGIINEVRKRKMSIFFKSVSKDLFPTSQQKESFDAMEQVVFVGYPSGIYDTVNHLPIIRTGTTATPLNIDYLDLPQFLIDGSVFPGSSGSPVFIFNKGSYSPRRGGLVVGSRLIFLGLVSEVYLRSEEGTWDFVDIPTKLTPVLKTPQMIDLGIAVKASMVLETIEAFLKSKGEIK